MFNIISTFFQYSNRSFVFIVIKFIYLIQIKHSMNKSPTMVDIMCQPTQPFECDIEQNPLNDVCVAQTISPSHIDRILYYQSDLLAIEDNWLSQDRAKLVQRLWQLTKEQVIIKTILPLFNSILIIDAEPFLSTDIMYVAHTNCLLLNPSLIHHINSRFFAQAIFSQCWFAKQMLLNQKGMIELVDEQQYPPSLITAYNHFIVRPYQNEDEKEALSLALHQDYKPLFDCQFAIKNSNQNMLSACLQAIHGYQPKLAMLSFSQEQLSYYMYYFGNQEKFEQALYDGEISQVSGNKHYPVFAKTIYYLDEGGCIVEGSFGNLQKKYGLVQAFLVDHDIDKILAYGINLTKSEVVAKVDLELMYQSVHTMTTVYYNPNITFFKRTKKYHQDRTQTICRDAHQFSLPTLYDRV